MSDDVKAHAQARFSQFAQNYVHSPVHAAGPDLDRMLELVAPQREWLALDVATGGGHTALHFAPHVRRVIAADLSATMLDAARTFIGGQGVNNVEYVGGDAERMPFADAVFDLVTCRVAAHHFPDAYRFMLECARVLKPGGTLAVHDHLIPEDRRAMDYIEAFERLRDPSHHRAFNDSEWRGLFLDAGLTVEHAEKLARPAKLVPWAERQGCPPDVIERLHILLAQAPQTVAEWISTRNVGSPDAGFDHVYILITGKKR